MRCAEVSPLAQLASCPPPHGFQSLLAESGMREANRHRSLNRFITLAPVTAAYLGSGRLVFPSLAFVLPWTACIRLAVQNAPAGVDTVSTLVSASHFTPACPLLLLSIADFTAGLVDYNPDRRLRSEILPWEECVSNGGGREGFPAVWAIAIFWFASTVPLLQSVMIFFPLLMCQWQVFWVFLCSLVWLPNAMPPLCAALSRQLLFAHSLRGDNFSWIPPPAAEGACLETSTASSPICSAAYIHHSSLALGM